MLMKRFEQLHQEKRSSMLLISHQERIIEMADQIMIISDGKVEAKGDADEMMPRLFGEQQGDCLCKQNGGGYCNA